ncbi:uncharacterized protein LOC117820949 isoform X5 [Xyrichtys novacula]|uniref:E3 ubiquitin-protein ligase n=1 Tax=Xyrichtys novacula TaxID=13765 RepID=A0AAV1EQX0_XYRNO|nr:uncharacterized protein LOC117820949 isoform X5 [Xyrichtys novacula]
MANVQDEEPMDCSEQPPTSSERSEQPSTASECSEQPSTSSEDKRKAQVTLTFKWSGDSPLQKTKLEIALQKWATKKYNGNCRVVNIQNGTAVIEFEPAPALCDLQELCGQTLEIKDKIKNSVHIMCAIVKPPNLETEIPDNTSEPQDGELHLRKQSCDVDMDRAPASEPQSVGDPPNTPLSSSPPKSQDVQPSEQSNTNNPAVSKADEENNFGILPVSNFLYVSYTCKEEVESILKKYGVNMETEAHVTFTADEKNGSPKDAYNDFTSLVQKIDYGGLDFPLKNEDPKKLMNALRIILMKESELLLTLSSDRMTVHGPSQSRDAIEKSLNTETNTDPSQEESAGANQDTLPNIGMNIQDPLLNSGLIFVENYWKLINTSFCEDLAKIKAKFGVDVKEFSNSSGQVKIEVCWKESGRNAAMESHALRALLHLYQKIATSPLNNTQPGGAAGFNGSLKNSGDESDEASGGPGTGKPGYHIRYNDAPIGEGATAAASEEDNCPICMDRFKNKKQLQCKHEFCEECLTKAKESMGAICPICKDVFGKVEGDQPPGTMKWREGFASLAGFSGCGSIIISYNIPSGTQTEKHPHPGKSYYGCSRQAFLPNNKEGKEVLQLLKRAFDQKLIFTVGTSRTTGREDQVTWNDIHHKTSETGGPQCFGYPDPKYLSRVREELKAKGIE